MSYTQLFIEGQEVDLSGTDVVSLVKCINDIRSLKDRDSDSSRTIELPGTKQNHLVFGHAFIIHGTGDYDFTKRAKALLKVNGLIQLEGFCMLMDCITAGLNDKFIINLYGGNVEWVNKIGNKELTDLDLSEYDHLWTGANIRSSWNNNEGYVYPLIEYGKFGSYDTTDNVNDYDMYPGIFVHNLIDKIFQNIDYRITGSFLSNPYYKKAILPFTNKDFEHNLQWKTDRDFTGTNSLGLSYGGGVSEKIYFNTVTGNKKVYWHNTNKKFTAIEAMIFNVNINALVSGGAGGSTLHIEIYKNGSPTGLELTHLNPATFPTPVPDYYIQGDLTIQLFAGDFIEFRFYGTSAGGGTTVMNIDNIVITSDISTLLTPGGLVRINDNLPKLKQIDLITTLFKMFGLIFQPDANSKTVQIDTFNQFYKKPDPTNPATFDDWSNKLDLTGNIERKFIYSGYGRNNLFKWKQDQDDSDIKEYMKTRPYPFSTGFGNGSHFIENDFLKPEETIADLPFASTWMHNSFNGLLHLPSIKKLIGNEYKGTPEPRILIYAGKVSVQSLTGNPNLNTLTIDTVQVSEIGYAYFWKKRYNDPELDNLVLNLYFDNEAVQYGTTLMLEYYPDLLNLITNARLVKCWVTLNEVDINILDYGKPVYISLLSSYFIRNKINDYKANMNHESCQAELIPII